MPNILAILPGLIPSTLINITTPLIDLHKAHLIKTRVILEKSVKDKYISWSDLIIFCRNVEPSGARWLSQVLEARIPYIYDIDDNFFELPVNTPIGKYHRAPARIAMLEEYIRYASLVRVYSAPMLERAKSLNPATVRVNGYVDWRLITSAPQAREKQPVKLVYATNRVDDTLAEIFKPALKKILENYSDRIQVYFLGYNPVEFKSYPNVFFEPLTLNYEKYMRHFSSAGFDIGLAPLLDDVFHRSKTNLKVREYGACHIAGIYSNVDTYSTSVTHAENGLLVENSPDAWYSAMSLLIENRELRMKIRDQAYRYAREHFSQEAFTQGWYSQISELLDRSREIRESDRSLQNRILDQFTVANPDLKSWLGRVIPYFASGLKADGIHFITSYIRIKIQLFWSLLKIKFALLIH